MGIWAAILPALISAGGSLAGAAASNQSTSEVPYAPEITQLLRQQSSRVTQANPLRQALLAWAQGLAPTFARSGLVKNTPPPAAGTVVGPDPAWLAGRGNWRELR